MARPSKYNWEAIQEAYEGGFDRAEICKKYRITPKILSNRIHKDKWEVKGSIKAEIMEFNEQVHKTTQNIQNMHEKNQELFIEKINTIAEDNELMQGTRKVAKLLLSVIAQSRNEITLKNIKTVSSTLKDIESIANPRPETYINNTNAQQNNEQSLKIEFVE